MAPFTFRATASGKRAVAKAERFGLMDEKNLQEASRLAGGTEYTKRGSGNNELEASEKSLQRPRL